MFEHKKIQKLNDFFIELSSRPSKEVYFYRISEYTEEIGQFIQKYYEAASKTGVIIEGKIPNPDEKHLMYYGEIMGMSFQMSLGFISTSLKKWLPRMNDYQRENVAISIYDSLDALRKEGKNENILKNAYIKFMCWLYYKFERIINQLGENKVPKILYEGEVSNYELILISILSKSGCDVVLLEYQGDQNYLKLDEASLISDKLVMPNMKVFPSTFNLGWIRQEAQKSFNNERLYGKKPEVYNCTNAWIEGNILDDIRKSTVIRGDDPKLFYNCFCRINGVEDKLTYMNELYQFQLELKNVKRKVVIVDGSIPSPTTDEIAAINRKNYAKQDQMLIDISNNIKYAANIELQQLMIKAFIDVMLEEAEMPDSNLNRLTNKAVYLVCWLKRYQSMLFANWRMPDISCFIYMGGCKNDNEALFLKMLSKLPIDVLILTPNLNSKCCLEDKILYEQNFVNTLAVDKFPQENNNLQIGTAAYHAERELDTLMYQDSGMYRNKQYTKANTVKLRTMFEEIRILWKEDVKYRPNFSTVDDVVNIPVVFAKVSGVKDGLVPQYWATIEEFITEDTILIKSTPFIESTDFNPIKSQATEFFKNGKLQKTKIKESSNYQYGFLREDIQNHMLDKLEMLIDQRLIKGTFENGTEYTIISTCLNLQKNILRMIQKFDFTKKNPKLLYINAKERVISLEDSIFVVFLSLLGFDIMFFVPTGYQSIERYFNKQLVEEHQIGDYIYDLQVPDLEMIPLNARQKLRDKIFRRGM